MAMKSCFLFVIILSLAFTFDAQAQWTRTASLPNMSVSSLSGLHDTLYAGTDNGLAMTNNGGATWSTITLPAATIYSVAYNDTSLLVGAGTALYRSPDGGQTWSVIRNCAPGHAFRSISLNDLHVFTAAYDSVYWSDDYGKYFNLVDSQLDAPISSQVGNEILSIVDNTVAEVMGTANGIYYLHFGDGYAKSALNGVQVTALTADYERCFAGTTNGFYLSTDWGQTWSPVTGPPGTVTALTIINTYLIAGTSDGHVYLSDESAQSWTNISNGLGSAGITSFALAGQLLCAGTVNDGVWRGSLSELTGNAVSATPISNAGIRCYPNPISESTTISFASEASGYAEISIINLLGTEVVHLYSGELDAGEQHTFEWNNPAAMPDGVYECLIRMNGQVETLPMVLIR